MPCTGPVQNIVLMDRPGNLAAETYWYPANDTSVSLRVELIFNGVVNGQAFFQGTWDQTFWQGQQIAQQLGATTTVQGGFTDSDRQLLTAAEKRTTILGEVGQLVVKTASGPINTTLSELFSRPQLDSLTLDELTAGETCEPVRVRVADWYFGIIVRVTTVAPELVPKTPDGAWYFPDLAVLRIFRGADLEYRRGIHETSFMVEKPWQWGWQVLNVARFFGVAADYTIAVDWRTGCCGRVFLQRFP